MIVKLEGTVEVPCQTILTAYRGLSLLHIMLKRKQLGGVETTEEIMRDLEEIMPELPSILALR
jgi:hypothetical protein